MRLDELLEEAAKVMPIETKVKNIHVPVMGITDNTNEVKEGFVFVCVKGASFDGHDAAEEMLKKARCALLPNMTQVRKIR